MKLIPLTQGKFAMVDNKDYDMLVQYKWHLIKGRYTFYARRIIINKNGRSTQLMHRLIFYRQKFFKDAEWPQKKLTQN